MGNGETMNQTLTTVDEDENAVGAVHEFSSIGSPYGVEGEHFLKFHKLAEPQASRLELFINSITQLKDDVVLSDIYLRSEPGAMTYRSFWKDQISRLYSEVFMDIALPKELISQCFIIDSIYPSSLSTVLAELVRDGTLIKLDSYLTPKVVHIKSSASPPTTNIFSRIGTFLRKRITNTAPVKKVEVPASSLPEIADDCVLIFA